MKLEYWNSLNLLQQILTVIALPASIALVAQFIAMIVGWYRSSKAQGKEANEQSMQLSHLSWRQLVGFRSICAFLSIGAWTGVLAVNLNASDLLAIAIAVVAGAVAVVLMAMAFNMES